MASLATPRPHLLHSRSITEPDNEQQLVLAAKSGDSVALGRLIELHSEGVLRLALRMTRSEHDARDVYQNTFLKALTAIKTFRGDCAFRTWVYRIAANFCIATLRERTFKTVNFAVQEEGEDSSHDVFESMADKSAVSNPEQQLLSGEVHNRISSAINKLTARERLVFFLKHYDGLRLREIGTILRTTEHTAKNTLFRATQKLRMELADLHNPAANRAGSILGK